MVNSNSLIVTNFGEVLVVDSRLVADNLNNQHESLMRLLYTHIEVMERRFGMIRFEVGASKMPDGRVNPNPEKFAWLTEDQATFLMTLCKNTDRVVECKANLVEAFSNKRNHLKSSEPISVLDALISSLQQLKIVENRVALEAQRTTELEAIVRQHDAELDRVFNPDGNYYTIRGYASLKGLNVNITDAKEYGKIATRLSLEKGYKKDSISDPRYGEVGAYSERILEQVFKS
jgi:phage regulator Rha-like protein